MCNEKKKTVLIWKYFVLASRMMHLKHCIGNFHISGKQSSLILTRRLINVLGVLLRQ